MIALTLLVLAAAPADVVQQLDVRASPSDVWKAWTTEAGATTFFAPKATIEARAGGAYEVFFDPSQPAGQRGSEGSTVIALEPQHKLSFWWTFPPGLPQLRGAGAKTQVTVELLPQGKTTRVRLTQTGFKDEPGYAEGRAYSERQWHLVLLRLAHRFRRAPIDWNKPWGPTPLSVFKFMEGNFVSAGGLQVENWSSSPIGMLGSSSATFKGAGVSYQLATIEPDDGEWVLALRLFKAGLSSNPQTEKEAARLVADVIEKDRVVFVSEFGEKMSVEYAGAPDTLTVTVKTTGHDETNAFYRRK